MVSALPAHFHHELLLRMIARRTGRTVWSHNGETAFDTGTGLIEVTHQEGRPEGSWIRIDPDMPVDEEMADWLWAVDTRTAVSETSHRPTGSMSFNTGDTSRRERFSRTMHTATAFAHHNPATGSVSPEGALPTPPGETEAGALHDFGHGSADGTLSVRLLDGSSRRLSEAEQDQWIDHLARSFKGSWISIARCWQGSTPGRTRGLEHSQGAPFVPDPLREISPGQRAANRSRLWVRASERVHVASQSPDGKPVHGLRTDAQGRRTRWELFRPEPSADDLARWAAELGMPIDTDIRREHAQGRVLVLVRALKLTFGRDVEDTEGFFDLLRGAAALEQMWRGDPRLSEAGLFTHDAFRRAVAAHPAGRQGVDQAGYRDALAAAAGARRGIGLTEFVTMPSVEAALRWLDDRDAAAAVSELLGKRLEKPAPVQVLGAFWARVKAEEVLGRDGTDQAALARRVLHLDPAEPVDAARLTELGRTLTRAFAEGRDAADPDVAAAYHLQRSGLLGRATSSTTLGLTGTARRARGLLRPVARSGGPQHPPHRRSGVGRAVADRGRREPAS
ncbi:lonely Cys domain-containing protein [Streptomyces sp. GKU 257-1]|nr:lonely Cys domain-containing protein [Streptomyces sp. GKU 257-1]